MLGRDVRTRIDDGGNLQSGGDCRLDRAPAVGVVGEQRDAVCRRRGVALDIAAHRRGHHHAGRVVAGKDDRPLDGAGCDDAALGDDPPQPLPHLVLGRGGDVVVDALERAIGAAVIDAEQRGAAHDADIGQRRQLGQRAGNPLGCRHAVDRAAVAEQPAAERKVLFAQDDARAGAAGRQRCRQPGRSAAGDQHVAIGPGLVVVVGIGFAGRASEAGGPADGRLVDRLPEFRRPHEGLVVEAGDEDRREQLVDRHEVVAQRRPAVLAGRFEAVIELGRGRLGVRLAARAAAQFDQRVGFFRAGGEQPARPVIFERAADQLDAIGDQRRGERVALVSGEGSCRRR